MRYPSKQALLADIRKEHDSLCARLQEIPKSRYREPGVWGDGWTLADLIAHLAEWQSMFLAWYDAGLQEVSAELPAPGYKWNETPRLNRAIWLKHQLRDPDSLGADFDSGYRRIVDIVEKHSAEQLLRPGHWRWTGKHSLATYLGPNTASHYRFALRVIKRWLKRESPIRRPAPGRRVKD
jgi:hypothetical protein